MSAKAVYGRNADAAFVAAKRGLIHFVIDEDAVGPRRPYVSTAASSPARREC
jgi:hypothetical protein